MRPYSRYSSRFDSTDARPSVPTTITRLALTGTDARPSVPTAVIRLALTQRTHRSCVPTKATRLERVYKGLFVRFAGACFFPTLVRGGLASATLYS